MPRNYRPTTPEEARKLEKAREMMQRGIAEEQDFLTRFMPTAKASAAREQREAKRLRESVDSRAREYEAYNQAGYADGGGVDDAGGYVLDKDGEFRNKKGEKPSFNYQDFRAALDEAKTRRGGLGYSGPTAQDAEELAKVPTRSRNKIGAGQKNIGAGQKSIGPERKYSQGGSIDGCAQRGKTRGRIY